MDKLIITFHDQIRSNKIRSVVLIFVIVIFFIVLGFLISLALDPSYFFIIMIIAIIFSLGYVWIGYYNSDKIALASSLIPTTPKFLNSKDLLVFVV